MQTTLTVRDEAMFGLPHEALSFTLNFPSEQISVRELIETRVREEVETFNRERGEVFRGLVQPTHAERALNGYKMREHKPIDPREQSDKAIQAFERNGFIVLVDDKQVECLDQIIEIKTKTTVTFLKLVPLVGG
jgi:hypothetical protein